MEGGGGSNKGQLKQKALMKDKVMKKEATAVGDDVESDDDIANYKASEEDEKKIIGGSGGGNNGKKIYGTCGGGGGSMRICQAERCTADLSDAKAKQYHRRHRVCELHAKAAAVVVAGISQRFCQQCSRFHELSEFDDTKRSCRRRLAGHNERRRKNTADPAGESSSRRGTAGCTQFMENVCVGQVDDRGRTQVTIGQENGNGSYNKHFPYQIK